MHRIGINELHIHVIYDRRGRRFELQYQLCAILSIAIILEIMARSLPSKGSNNI
jgi:hypothetical protein